MQFYRCKCGKCEAWGSMAPYPCSGCATCGTTLETHPELHRSPRSHDFSYVEAIETDQGMATITRCCWCLKRRDALDAEVAVKKAYETVRPIIEREAKLEMDRPSKIMLD